MPKEKPEVNTRKIAEVFNGQKAFQIPVYQRPYVWASQNVRDLIDDMREQQQLGEWLNLGLISICPTASHIDPNSSYEVEWYDIVDGQQRLTTIQIIFATINKLLHDAGGSFPNHFMYLETMADNGDEIVIPRLLAARQETRSFLQHIMDPKHTDLNQRKSLDNGEHSEVRSMRLAYWAARKHLESLFKRDDTVDTEGLRKFGMTIANKAFLIEATSKSELDAARAFEKVNNRGVRLEQIDLLKTRFLAGYKNDPDFAKKWDQLIETLPQGHGDNFLRYYLAKLKFELYPAQRIFEIFVDKIEKDPKLSFNASDKLLENMASMAAHYSNFISYKGPFGRKIMGLDTLKQSGGKRRQHALLLMAGIHLNEIDEDLFDLYAEEIEKLLFVSTTAGILPNEDERQHLDYCRQISQVKDKKDLLHVLQNTFQKRRKELEGRFKEGLIDRTATETDGDFKRGYSQTARYIVWRIAHLAQQTYESKSIDFEEFAKTHEMEHIGPRNKNDLSKDRVTSIGNLIVLSRGPNGSSQDLPLFSAPGEPTKMSHYRQGPVINQMITGNRAAFGKPGMTLLSQSIPTFAEWNDKSVDDLKEAYLKMAENIWIKS